MTATIGTANVLERPLLGWTGENGVDGHELEGRQLNGRSIPARGYSAFLCSRDESSSCTGREPTPHRLISMIVSANVSPVWCTCSECA